MCTAGVVQYLVLFHQCSLQASTTRPGGLGLHDGLLASDCTSCYSIIGSDSRIVAEYGPFNRICQVAAMCTSV